LLPELARRSEARAQAEPELRRFVERNTYFESLGRETQLSIDESVRRREQEDHSERLLRIENRYRVAKGEEPLGSLDELNAPADPEEGDDGQDVAATPTTDEIDPVHVEAARILADYVALQRPR
jgi:carboxyl-terminal processing protease